MYFEHISQLGRLEFKDILTLLSDGTNLRVFFACVYTGNTALKKCGSFVKPLSYLSITSYTHRCNKKRMSIASERPKGINHSANA